MDVRPLRDSRDRPWGFLGLIGMIALVAAALLVGPSLLAPRATPPPSVAPSVDPHVVAAAQGTFEIAYDPTSALVIRRLDGSSPTELGREPLSPDQGPATVGGPFYNTGEWTLACPGAAGSEAIRMIFGTLFAPSVIGGGQYLGPPASWSMAPDGMFLVVLDPGPVEPGAQLRVTTRGGMVSVDASAFDQALAEGTLQPSGCFVE
jgi:hypothetical protein